MAHLCQFMPIYRWSTYGFWQFSLGPLKFPRNFPLYPKFPLQLWCTPVSASWTPHATPNRFPENLGSKTPGPLEAIQKAWWFDGMVLQCTSPYSLIWIARPIFWWILTPKNGSVVWQQLSQVYPNSNNILWTSYNKLTIPMLAEPCAEPAIYHMLLRRHPSH